MNANARQVTGIDKETQSYKIRIVKRMVLPPRSQKKVRLQSFASKISLLQSSP